ncbi:MAG: hypothetical protein J6C97_04215 [Clostridia bacterium]|nr:hypothetical protein [Clostridia bacterium]
MKNYGIKIILAIIFFVISLFLSNDLGVIKIEKTAIITAIAIDQENDDIKISAQIALPQAVDIKTNADSIVVGYGKTIGLAIDNIAVKTGWYPKLSFCNLVIVNQDIGDKLLPEIINYVLYSKKIYDNILICYAEKKADDILKATGTLDNIASFSLQKILLKNADNANAVYFSRVKDIAINLTGESKQSLIPLIKLETDDFTQKTETGESKNTAVFNATTTILLNNGKTVGKFNKEQTLFYNLIVKGVKEIYFEVPLTENSTALLKVINSKRKIKIYPQGELAKLKIDLSLNVYLIDIKSSQIFESGGTNVVPTDILQKADKKVREQIENLVDISKTTSCDFFEIKDNLFRFYPKFYSANKNFDISNTLVEVNVSIKPLDKN